MAIWSAVSKSISRLFPVPYNQGGQPGVSGTMTPDAFNQMINDASSFSITLDSGTRNAIQWIAAKERLLIGTTGGEWRFSGHSNKPFTPTNFDLKPQTVWGSKDMQAMVLHEAVLFVDYVGRKLREMTWNGTNERYVSPDLLLLAEHITLSGGITTMAYQKRPDSIIWATLSNGDLISCTYDKEQDVIAWARHPLETGGNIGDTVYYTKSVQTRDEAYAISANDNIVWIDENYSVLDYESLGTGSICDTVDSDSTGIVVAGYANTAAANPRITRWDTDLTADTTFFVPDGGWNENEGIGTLRFTDDDAYLYAITSSNRVIKFNASTGATEWIKTSITDRYGFYVDSGDNWYNFRQGALTSYIDRYDSDGTLLSETLTYGTDSRDIEVDLTNQRIYRCGNGNKLGYQLWGVTNKYIQITAADFGNTQTANVNYFTISDYASATVWNIVKSGDYIYAAGDRYQSGVGGAWASVWKLDTSLNLVASYDTGMKSYEIWVDHDGNIAVASGYYPGGDTNAGVWILDTDLTYIADYRVPHDTTYGIEAINVPYMSTPSIATVGSGGETLGANSVCVIPGDEEDEIWVSLTRVIDDELVRYIERMKPRYWGTDQEDCFFVDSGLSYDSTATTSFSGLSHLEGETVAILGDGAVFPTQTVSSGAITLSEAVSVCHIGLPYTYKLKPMRMDQNYSGTTKGSVKKITEAVISFYKTLNAQYSDGTDTRGIDFRTTEEYTTPPDLYTGDKVVVADGGFSAEDPFQIEGSDPLPCTVRAIIPRIDKTGR